MLITFSSAIFRRNEVATGLTGISAWLKGSGIHVISNQSRHYIVPDEKLKFANCGLSELFQARQLIESNIAEFAATQITKQDITKLIEIQEKARNEKNVFTTPNGICNSTFR